MYKYYGIVGDSQEWTIPDELFSDTTGWVLMNGPRPDPSFYASNNGEWLQGPSPVVKAAAITQAKLDKSKLISDASDKIETLKDRIEAGQDKAAELKLWKSYRIALDDVDVSSAPDIEWPVSPDTVLSEA
ncbi:TPA: tail fiber assembly protein [Yersinia enterocolitica]